MQYVSLISSVSVSLKYQAVREASKWILISASRNLKDMYKSMNYIQILRLCKYSTNQAKRIGDNEEVRYLIYVGWLQMMWAILTNNFIWSLTSFLIAHFCGDLGPGTGDTGSDVSLASSYVSGEVTPPSEFTIFATHDYLHTLRPYDFASETVCSLTFKLYKNM
jgi:hypothetical protein